MPSPHLWMKWSLTIKYVYGGHYIDAIKAEDASGIINLVTDEIVNRIMWLQSITK